KSFVLDFQNADDVARGVDADRDRIEVQKVARTELFLLRTPIRPETWIGGTELAEGARLADRERIAAAGALLLNDLRCHAGAEIGDQPVHERLPRAMLVRRHEPHRALRIN